MTGLYYRWLIVGVWVCSLAVCSASQHWIGVAPRVVTWPEGVPAADRVRLGVRDPGVYRVSAAEIAVAAGVPLSVVSAALDTCGLALTCQGQSVAWTADGDALFFYGVPTVELFAPENVYWLSFRQGVAMGVADATPDAANTTNQWFLHAESYRTNFLAPYDARDRRSGAGTLTNVLNFGEWIPASSTESIRVKTQTVSVPGFSASAVTPVVARVSLVSYHDFSTPDNQLCEVWLNGTYCGATNWSDEQALVFDYVVPQGVVTSEVAQIKVRNGLTSSVSDFMLLDATLIYPRRYRAAGGALLCTGGDAQTVAVDGFATPQLRVWDITVPETPLELVAPVGPATNGTWEVAFACGDAGARYAVFDTSEGYFQPSVSGVRDTDWSDPAEMPEFAIVIPPRRWVSGFDEAVQPLANFRTAQGLRTRIIDAEELYNAFSDGLVHPKAFQMFSAAGVTNGATQTLRYLLFAGHGGSDYKLEVFRLGQDERYPTLFPLYLFHQVEVSGEIAAALLLPNDPVLGNAVGGAVPEVAVGRFIATNALELALMVDKTIRYELTETWKNKALFVACKQYYPSDPNFSNSVARTAAGFAAGGWAIKGFYPQAQDYWMDVLWDYDYDNTGVRYELAKGTGFLYYYGHSSDTLLGVTRSSGQWFIQSKTIMTNDTWKFAPVAMLMGCRIGRWTMLDLKTREQCIAEAGVRNPIAGFSAVISAAGYLQPTEAEDFANGFRDCIAAGALRLGDAWCGAFASMGDAAAAESAQHMTLLGDPSLCIRTGETARGTPSTWLIAQGLTNDPYADLKDQDADGFVTWQEYQAGTDYLLNSGLRIRALSVPGALETGMPLAFEPLAAKGHRVLSTTNLTSGVWEPLPWRVDASAPWSSSAIPGDWPKKAVEVPYSREEPQRFYRIEAE